MLKSLFAGIRVINNLSAVAGCEHKKGSGSVLVLLLVLHTTGPPAMVAAEGEPTNRNTKSHDDPGDKVNGLAQAPLPEVICSAPLMGFIVSVRVIAVWFVTL
jgi:hypothetical protein